MRRLFRLVFAMTTACASANVQAVDSNAPIDLTGADVAKWDSLSRTYAVGPTLLELPLPLMPVPAALRGTRLSVVCTVDEHGKLVRLSMSPISDPAYGRRLANAWRSSLRFRPATTREGSPTRGYYLLNYDF